MKRIMMRLIGFTLLMSCTALLFSACSSSQLTKVWQDPAYKGPMKSMLIISITRDPIKRRVWEDVFVSEFAKYGVAATPSYSLFPDTLPDTNQIANVIHQSQYDGMLIISRLRTRLQTTTVAPFEDEVPVTTYNPWRKEYQTRFEEEYNPGYTDTSKIVRHEINIWSAKEDSHMVWSARCLTQDPISGQQIHDETVGLVAPALASAGLIPLKQ